MQHISRSVSGGFRPPAFDRIEVTPRERVRHMMIRISDVMIALCVLAFFAPLIVVIAAGIYATDRGPIFFAHKRIGRHARLFHCFKFRSMVTDADDRLRHLLSTDAVAIQAWTTEHKLRDDPRVTSLGRFLRKSSLDELPQLFNVLRGEMSLVGPRPIVLDEVRRYGRYFSEYCQVRPGITGLWQISGRSDVSYRRRVALDVRYVRTQRFRQNLRILALTIPSVLLARGSC